MHMYLSSGTNISQIVEVACMDLAKLLLPPVLLKDHPHLEEGAETGVKDIFLEDDETSH
jgi:hypothetical protein